MKEHFKMVEIYSGKDDKWKGFYNLIISNGDPAFDFPIAGPIHPEVSVRILNALEGIKEERKNDV